MLADLVRARDPHGHRHTATAHHSAGTDELGFQLGPAAHRWLDRPAVQYAFDHGHTHGAGHTASVDGSTSTSSPGFLLDDVGSPGNTTSGRNLTGSVTIEQLLGGWTVMVGAEQCRLNLTYTAKGSTGRYRASTPGCLVDGWPT